MYYKSGRSNALYNAFCVVAIVVVGQFVGGWFGNVFIAGCQL